MGKAVWPAHDPSRTHQRCQNEKATFENRHRAKTHSGTCLVRVCWPVQAALPDCFLPISEFASRSDSPWRGATSKADLISNWLNFQQTSALEWYSDRGNKGFGGAISIWLFDQVRHGRFRRQTIFDKQLSLGVLARSVSAWARIQI